MIDWSDEQKMVQRLVRQFVDDEIRPHVDALEHGDLPPYDIIRKLFATFGLDALARETFAKRIARERDVGPPTDGAEDDEGGGIGGGGAMGAAMRLIPIIEICRVSPGITTAMGVSLGLAAGTIMKRGTVEQKERWGLDLLTFDKVGAWAITEPDAGSDAFGGMKTTVRRDGDGYVLNGNKTFITNGPYADTTIVYAKLDEGEAARDRRIVSFVLDRGMDGFSQPPPFAKMGNHSSPTGELFFDDVHLEADRLLGGPASATQDGRDSARSNFTIERSGVAAMALGVIEECLQLSVAYAKDRTLWGQRIGDFQLIQLKLATMEVARLNVQNLVFRHLELLAHGREPTLAEASAMKLYAAQAATQVAMEAVQLFGGNGYMAEYRVEQLARDAKAFQIYAGTDEVQITHIAKDLLAR